MNQAVDASVKAAWRAAGRLAALPSRHAIGMAWAQAGRVADLKFRPGCISADVRIPGAPPQHVQLRATPADTAEQMVDLVPLPDELNWACSCAEVSPPCAHAVAVWAAAGSYVLDNPAALTRWRNRFFEKDPVSLPPFWGEAMPAFQDTTAPPSPKVPFAFRALGPLPTGRGRLPLWFANQLTDAYRRMAERAKAQTHLGESSESSEP